MHRIVHLDLKGAPLKVDYLEKVVLVIKSWGATGILFEWEDTFPYSSDLVMIGSVNNSGGDNMYSLEEVKHILEFTTNAGMTPIQLIQTIGHMEFVLKHPAFRDLREVDRSPAVLCPSKPRSQELVREMVNQVLEVQPNAEFLHIGADEVWHSGVCTDCQSKAANNVHQKDSLYLDHIKNLALYIREKNPNITILIWDDMLRNINPNTLKEYALGGMVEPVVWFYNSIENFDFNTNILENYAQIFTKVWVGSAFKGANGSCQVLSPVKRYVSNHQAWAAILKNYSNRINFNGIILTGWSRYDHYATLCELLPVSLPSLASCLRTVTITESVPIEQLTIDLLPSSEWPGEEVYRCVHTFEYLRNRCQLLLESDLVGTWLNPWQISRQFTVPVHIESIAVAAQQLLTELLQLRTETTACLLQVTGKRSTEEWVQTYIEPFLAKITQLYQIAQSRSAPEQSASVHPIYNT